jgi:hypothetical protein
VTPLPTKPGLTPAGGLAVMANVPEPALRVCAASGEMIGADTKSDDTKKPLTSIAMAFRILFVRFLLARLLLVSFWLVPFRRGRQLKTNAEIIVLLRRGFQIEVRDCDLAMMPGRQVIKHVSHNSVILDFYLVAIFEDEHSLRLIGDCSFRRLVLRR